MRLGIAVLVVASVMAGCASHEEPKQSQVVSSLLHPKIEKAQTVSTPIANDRWSIVQANPLNDGSPESVVYNELKYDISSGRIKQIVFFYGNGNARTAPIDMADGPLSIIADDADTTITEMSMNNERRALYETNWSHYRSQNTMFNPTTLEISSKGRWAIAVFTKN